MEKLDFSVKLHNKVAEAESGDFFISPYSIQVALGMCAAGARGETLKELLAFLEMSADEHQNTVYSKLLRESNDKYELISANALWLHNEYQIRPEYVDIVAGAYQATLKRVDYKGNLEEVVSRINSWVAEQTKNKIPTLVTRDLVSSLTKLILTNAVYFKGQWEETFVKSQTQREMWQNDERRYNIQVMNRTGQYNLFEGDKFKVLELPYQGDDLSMLVFLPNISFSLKDIDLTPNLFNVVVNNLTEEERVVVKFPKFKLEKNLRLGDLLRQMGVNLSFGDEADFSGIGEEPLKISEVVHASFVDVNEEGTEAAAATAVVMKRCAVSMIRPPEKQFFATRPFVFFIRNVKTNTVLFAGRLVNPEEAVFENS